MTTIKDIARMANVSTATVSYVLNKTKPVSEETNKRVMDAIEEMNYSPNSIAKSLRRNKTNTIGVLAEDIRALPSPGIINGISEYMENNGYNILFNDMRLLEKLKNRYDEIGVYKNKINNAVKLLTTAKVDGIIYVGMHDRNIDGIVENIDVPLVFSYCYTKEDSYQYVTYNNMKSAYEMIKYLISMGHERIAIISGPKGSYPSIKRFDGFYLAMDEYKLKYDNPEYVYTGDWEYQSGFDAACSFLQLEKPPTAIFAMNDLMAIGAIDAITKANLSVPEDISVVGFDDREFSAYIKPKLTTVSLPLEEIGNFSAQLMVDTLNKKTIKKENILPCDLIKRDSVCNAKI